MNPANQRTLITGLIALVFGLAIGVGAAEFRKGTANAGQTVSAASVPPSSTIASHSHSTPQTWDPFLQIRDMQMQMDKLLSRMSAEFRAEPPFHGMVENPAYSLSMNVEDLKDRFVVRAFLPDTSVADVKVRLDGQTLKVEVGNRQNSVSKTKTSTRRVAEWGEYEQVIQLPSPVKAGQMKVARKDHELLITLPKE